MALTQVAGGMIASGQSIASPTFTGTSTFAGGVANAYGFGVGTAVPSSGAGITFPATQSASSDANTLDDYEEGSWTPNVISGSNNSTWASKSGRYIKVGGIVTCWFVCDAGNSGTAGTFLRVTGLPFTPVTIPNGCSTGIWGTNSTTPQVTGNIFNDGGTQAFFYGGNQITTQASYASGVFTYQAA